MKSTPSGLVARNKTIFYIALGTILLWMVPLVAMQFTSDVSWGAGDFIIAGSLLFGTGLLYELISRKIHSLRARIIIGVILVLILALLWIELAVGIFN